MPKTPGAQDSALWPRVEELLDDILPLEPNQRAAYLEQVDPEIYDAATRAEALKLAELGEASAPLLDRPAMEVAARVAHDLAVDLDPARAQQRLGAWQLGQPLGSGGMGRVFAAERVDGSYQQRAALKVLRWETAEPELVARFQRERQILAHLDHPNIAGLLDGGVTDTGLPWLAMELIDGEPIDRWAESQSLDVEERVELVERVCAAVQYAHSRLVIHRDLKPSNILVAEAPSDAASRPGGQVKLLDFGIAKLLDAEAMKATQLTQHAAPLTPRYAAPEQLTGGELSTATDVWSLGVLLYELLSKRHPFDSVAGGGSEIELRRAILELDPAPPSRAASSSVSRTVRGDLDNIVLRALRKDPAERYASAGALAEDLERYRGRLPVRAQAPTFPYLVSRFVSRHRAAVVAAAAGLTVLTTLVGGFLHQLQSERDRAVLEAAKAEEVTDFVVGLFETNDPGVSGGREITARTLLDDGAARIDQQLAGQSEVRAQMKRVLGSMYQKLGRYEASRPLLEEAVALERTHPSAGPGLVRALLELSVLETSADQYSRAEELAREALQLARSGATVGDAVIAEALNALGIALAFLGRHEEADEALLESLELSRDVHGPQHQQVGLVLQNLAFSQQASGDYASAERSFRDALAIHREVLPPEHPVLVTALDNLGLLLSNTGQLDAAEEALMEAWDLRRSTLGEEHPAVATSMNNLANLYRMRGEHDRSLSMLQGSLQINLAAHQQDSHTVATSYGNLGTVQLSLGRLEEARENLLRALEIRRRVLGEGHVEVAQNLAALAFIDMREASLASAEAFARDAVSAARAAVSEGNLLRSDIEIVLARILLQRGVYAEALQVVDGAMAPLQGTVNPANPPLLFAGATRGLILERLGRNDEALAQLRESLPHLEKFSPEGDATQRVRLALERLGSRD